MTAAATGAARTRVDVRVMAQAGVSRTVAQALIDGGHVRVNERPARAGQRVRPEDIVAVTIPRPVPATRPPGPDVPLTVVFEDAWLAVVDKPAGLVVHPAPGHPTGTLADGLRQRGSTWSSLAGGERPGIVHRLDRDTSGLLVVAKTEEAHRSLAAQLQARTLTRVYWTLVHGRFREAAGRIEAPIGRHPVRRQRMAVVDSGRDAVTDFRVTERLPRTTVLEVRLRTGRTHQIRVHLAHIHHPIVGDSVYGRSGDPLCARPALHAARLAFRHPGDGRECAFESPLVPELEVALAAAREAQ